MSNVNEGIDLWTAACLKRDGHPTLCEPFRSRVIQIIGPEKFQEIKLLTNTCAQFDKSAQIEKLKEYLA